MQPIRRWENMMDTAVGGKMVVYADASALVKRVVEEEGSELAATVWETAQRVIASALAYPEARAALGAARVAGRLDAADLRQGVRRLEQVYADVELVQVDEQITALAGGLAERCALGGADAVHLATALSLDAPRVVVATWNQDLAKAASENGLAVVPRVAAAVAA
jgi:predicted nucleic acid-binding protein